MCKILRICEWVGDVWWMRRHIDGWSKLVYRPINPSTNTRKIVKLCADVYRYRYRYRCGRVNVNVADSASVNDNVADCVDVYEKIFSASIDKAKWLCYNGPTK